MQCPHCGNRLLDGFQFCHHCGKAAMSAPVPEETPPLFEPEPSPFDTEAPVFIPPEDAGPEETEIQDSGLVDSLPVSPENDSHKAEPAAFFTERRLFLLELLCYVPILNIVVLAVLATSAKSPLRAKMAQMKLLAMMVVIVILMIVALTVIALIAADVLPPLYLGRWGR